MPSEPAPVLSALQVQAAHLLSVGQSPTQVALTLQVGRATLYRWQQLPDFVAYFNQLLRQRSDEATAAASHLLTRSLQLLQQKLDDPATSPELQLRLAFKIAALYSRPSFLQHLADLSDDPEVIAEAQYHQSWRNRGTTPPDYVDKSDVQYYQGSQHDRLAQAQAFDQAYPHPEQPAPRDEVRQNETPKACLTPPAPAPRDKTRPRLLHFWSGLGGSTEVLEEELLQFRRQVLLPLLPQALAQ